MKPNDTAREAVRIGRLADELASEWARLDIPADTEADDIRTLIAESLDIISATAEDIADYVTRYRIAKVTQALEAKHTSTTT